LQGEYGAMTQLTKRIYMDVCALCRPFDDQTQMRIRMETDAIQLILSYVRSGRLVLTVSPVHVVEIDAIDEVAEREHLKSVLQQIGRRVVVDIKHTRSRAEQLLQLGLGPADAAHLAFAEGAQANFITCDDRLIRQCRRFQTPVWFGAPNAFCDKENLK
jgi:predicted nucleic acid-binding protein